MRSKKLMSEVFWESSVDGRVGGLGRGEWEEYIRVWCGKPVVCPVCAGEGTGTKRRYGFFGEGVCGNCDGDKFVVMSILALPDGDYLVMDSCDENGKVS